MKTFLLVLLLATAALACSPNCNDCDPAASICFACAEGFQLSVLGTCVDTNKVPKCNLYSPANQCFACQPTFSINNGQCLKDFSACLAYDAADDSKCMTCAFGTNLKNGACAGPINCNATTGTNCTSCIKGFTLTKGACNDNTGNCDKVGTNGVCSTCKKGYNLVGYSCLLSNITVYGCYVFDAAGVCQACKAGYNIYQGSCLLPSQIQQVQQGLTTLSSILEQRNTVSVITTTTTTTTTTSASPGGDFGSGFGSGFGGFGGFDDASGAFGGNGGFGDFGNGGGFGGQSAGSPPPNCQGYDPANPSVCFACVSGYYLSSAGACVQVSIFCGNYNLQTGACFTCNFGFQVQNGQCNDPNCLAQTAAGCTSCRSGFTLNGQFFCQQNDPRCSQFSNGVCQQCQNGFFVGSSGLCAALPANCLGVGPNFICNRCANGFQLNTAFSCVVQTVTVTNNTVTTTNTFNIANCAQQSGSICNQCFSNFQLINNQCVGILIPNCQTLDPSNPTNCRTCLSGFTLNNGACVQTTSPSTPFCQSYNLLTGQCIACINGYILSGSVCILNPNAGGSSNSASSSTTITTTTTTTGGSSNGGGAMTISGSGSGAARDPNCARYNGTACAACSNRYYFGPNILCIPVNPLCNNYTSTGACLSCYPGYTLSGSNCIVSRQQDPFCKTYNQGGVCTSCYTGFYYNQLQALCMALNPLCKTSNLTDGSCLTCFPGYSINGGLCTVSFQDPNCQKWDSARSLCTQCSTRFFIDNNGRCKQINPLCKTSDPNTGACLSCYPGYIITGPNCVVGGAGNSDVSCQTNSNGVCTKCYSGYFLDNSNRCRQNNPLCKTTDPANGNCLSCYPGYGLNFGNCTVSASATTSSDTNCRSTDQSGVCTGCYSGYFLTPGMSCQKMDPLCRNYTSTFNGCTGCYDGYSLSGISCVLTTQVTGGNSDPYCVKLQGTTCINCSSGYYLSASTGVCTALNPYCKESNMANGDCLSCYNGYALSGNTCIVAAPVSIAFCNQVAGNVCIDCINGYYVKDGACALVNVLCATYDRANGNCQTCVPGYVFQAGQCILPSLGIDPNCLQYSNSYCTQCGGGYALVNYYCNPIDPLCTQYNPATNSCTACSQGKIPQGPSCI